MEPNLSENNNEFSSMNKIPANNFFSDYFTDNENKSQVNPSYLNSFFYSMHMFNYYLFSYYHSSFYTKLRKNYSIYQSLLIVALASFIQNQCFLFLLYFTQLLKRLLQAANNL